ncbi:PAS domain S-box protein [bacterium]|nr:PAS domain S-box protein [bacterium]
MKNGNVQPPESCGENARESLGVLGSLSESERYCLLADMAMDWEYWVRPDGSLGYVSPSCERITGYRADEFIQDPDLMRRVVHPDDWRRVGEDHIRKVAECPREACDRLEFRVIRRDGVERWISHLCWEFRDAQGRPLGRRGSNRDITDEVAERETFEESLVESEGRFRLAVGSDITALKKSEDALRESQRDLNRAQAVAHTGSWRLDVREDRLIWSEENHRIFGVPCGTAMTYEFFLKIAHPEDRGFLQEKWTAALAGAAYDVEHRIIVDGRVKWGRERAELELDENGNPVAGFGTTQDITDLKQAEELIQSEALFPQENPFPVLRATEEGILTFANRASASLLRCWGCGVGEVAPEAVLELIREAVRDDLPRETEVRCDDRDIWLVLVPITEKGHVNIYGRDVTNRKAVEDALRRSEQRYRSLFISMSEGFAHNELVVDEEGRPVNYRFLELNPAFEEQTGLKAADVVGRTVLEVMPQTDLFLIERYGQVVLTGQPAHFESYFGALDRWYEVHAFRTQPMRFGVVFLDVTQRKIAEERLLKLNAELEDRVRARTAELEQRAEQLARLASELTLAEQRERRRLAQILHDHLQQLLVGAKFGLEALVRRVPEDQKDRVVQIDDLLTESIRASRSLTMELSPPILHEAGLAAGLEWLSRWMAEKHGLEVNLKGDSDATTDREDVKVLLFQSTRELLFNVVKHAGVTQARVELTRQGDDHLRVEVSDGGVGFETSEMWDRSSRMSGGFGLFSIRERLQMLGGRLEISSEPQHGSRFTLIAPMRSPLAAARTDALPEKDDLPEESAIILRRDIPDQIIKVLVVDDHAVMREGLTYLLEDEEDLEVVAEAPSGREAVRLAGQLRPDVILMDFSMPGMDGVEATRIIHAEHPEIRIIGLSMYEESDRSAAMLAAGAATYVTKSGRPEALVAAVRGLGSRRTDE